MDEPQIVYEDKQFLVINKPAGMQMHPARVASGMAGARTRPAMLTDWLLARHPELAEVGDDPATRPGIVHRLDKATSGILIVPREQEYFEYLKRLFQSHEVKKTYLALVFGAPKQTQGMIDAPIGIRNGTVKRSVHSEKMAKSAITRYELVRTFEAPPRGEAFSLLKIYPETGRTHQIRVHLASIGHPIAGDELYGSKKQPPWAARLMLHALSLEFPAADGKRMRFEAEPPKGFIMSPDQLSTGPPQGS